MVYFLSAPVVYFCSALDNWYIEGTKEAVVKLIGIIRDEHAAISKMKSEYDRLIAKRNSYSENFRTMDLQEDFSDAQIMHAFNTAGEANEKAQEVQKWIDAQTALRQAKASSYASICGALLQIAKQGLSAQFGNQRNNAPEGRLIDTEPLRNVIWEGRNQSMHFETDEAYKCPLRNTFEALRRSHGETFAIAKGAASRSIAGEVIELVGWTEYQCYEDDMKTLLG